MEEEGGTWLSSYSPPSFLSFLKKVHLLRVVHIREKWMEVPLFLPSPPLFCLSVPPPPPLCVPLSVSREGEMEANFWMWKKCCFFMCGKPTVAPPFFKWQKNWERTSPYFWRPFFWQNQFIFRQTERYFKSFVGTNEPWKTFDVFQLLFLLPPSCIWKGGSISSVSEISEVLKWGGGGENLISPNFGLWKGLQEKYIKSYRPELYPLPSLREGQSQ